jgi:RNA polymerase sigma factor (TIGR02999 family)
MLSTAPSFLRMEKHPVHLLEAIERGDEVATDRLFELLYGELRRCAHRQRGGSGETLSTTALVHETYVKLVANERVRLESRRHFMALAARAMRQVLVDHARRSGADKRGGGAIAVTLDERLPDAPSEAVEVLALDAALAELERIDERAARVVQLHFFGGLTFLAIAELEGLNERTIKRDWQAARHMLAASMGAHPAD